MAVELERVQARVAELGLEWQPGETVHSEQSLLQLRGVPGVVGAGRGVVRAAAGLAVDQVFE